jgi:hypothetical protein
VNTISEVGGVTMNRTVGEHIQTLEHRRTLLSGRITEEKNRGKRNQLETELRAVESALALYRSALEIEARVYTKSAAT